jgi:Ca2+-binding RTX toxin-like protein
MPIQFLNGHTYDAYSGTVADQIQVDPLATVHATAAGKSALLLASGPWPVLVYGKVVADSGNAISLKDAGPYASASLISIGADAEITGGGEFSDGINAAHATNIGNSGTIKGGLDAINEWGEGGATYQIVNTASGVMDGGTIGVRVSFSGQHAIGNFGTISGGQYAIFAGDGQETVVNAGTLTGNVQLGDGSDYLADSFGGHSGIVTGLIDLGKGDDLMLGGDNQEVVRDGGGLDRITFAGGNDQWFGFLGGGGDGADVVYGGPGADTYIATKSGVQGFAINLDTHPHNGVIATTAKSLSSAAPVEKVSGFENVVGTSGADLINGSKAANLLVAGAGGDRVFGFAGNDTLKGEAGKDTLTAGLGKDALFGGADRDIFDFNSIAESKVGANRDTIGDFHRGNNTTGDDIDLRDIDAKTGVGGNQAFKFIGTQEFHHSQGELHYKDLGASCLVQGDVNGDAHADFEILVKVGALSAGDFLL